MTHPNTPNSPWTDERIERLKVLYAGGMSAAKIAVEMGLATRMAVIGKIDRLKLVSPHGDKHRPRNRDYGARDAKPKAAQEAQIMVPRIKPEPFTCADAEDAGPPLHKSLVELGLDECRYPFGDRDYTFCGHPVWDAGPYCGPHARLCWRAPNQKGLVR